MMSPPENSPENIPCLMLNAVICPLTPSYQRNTQKQEFSGDFIYFIGCFNIDLACCESLRLFHSNEKIIT